MNAVRKICTLWRTACLGLLAVGIILPLGATGSNIQAEASQVPATVQTIELLNTVPAAAMSAAKVRKANSKRASAMRWAKTQAGKRYCSPGGNSGTSVRSCYDCSGLVGTAYRRAGIKGLSGGTSNFMSSGKLKRVTAAQARWGDLVFMYGGGHVEMFGHWHNKARTVGTSFGAHNSRTPAGYRTFDSGDSPRIYRVVGAG